MTASYSMDRYSTARFEIREAREAKWARRMALFFLQLLILTVTLHRFFGLGTPAAINLIGVSMVGMLIAVIIAVASLIRIWFGGQTGAAQDFGAIVLGLIGLALPVYFLFKAVLLPPLTDVQTTPADPLQFTVLVNERLRDANPLVNPDAEKSAMQAEAYGDIGPMYLERSAPEVFVLVNEAVGRLGWTVVVNETPGESGIGRIEATDRSMIMGFTDDVVVRVKGDDAHTLIDVRSASRYGMHDFGANADRIRALYGEVNAALEKGEKTVLEQAAPKKEEEPVAAPAKEVTKKARRRGARKRR
ncbi:MAG TPA: DUF1499 domain-containing protein [Methyloceanibacter sp.]|nr:DUF1499 domain-containing protein [Methyloceanibacter sp.]